MIKQIAGIFNVAKNMRPSYYFSVHHAATPTKLEKVEDVS